MYSNAPRIVNMAVGLWLFISAFLWPHSQAQFTNTLVVGVLCAAFAALAFRIPPVRWANMVLAIWLFISVFALPTISTATVWNNAIFAVIMFIVALLPGVYPRTGTATSLGRTHAQA